MNRRDLLKWFAAAPVVAAATTQLPALKPEIVPLHEMDFSELEARTLASLPKEFDLISESEIIDISLQRDPWGGNRIKLSLFCPDFGRYEAICECLDEQKSFDIMCLEQTYTVIPEYISINAPGAHQDITMDIEGRLL